MKGMQKGIMTPKSMGSCHSTPLSIRSVHNAQAQGASSDHRDKDNCEVHNIEECACL